jgi:hypothetical protein
MSWRKTISTWVPVELIERAQQGGAKFGYRVVSIEGSDLAMTVDLGDGRVVFLLLSQDETTDDAAYRPIPPA